MATTYTFTNVINNGNANFNQLLGQLPTPTSWVRFCDERAAQARMVAITLNGFAPWSHAVSIVVRTSASACAAHMAR